jgi:hypothetical protein
MMPVLFDDEPNGCIKIGLINNMSDEALKATERQFIRLLESASDNMPIHLSFYTLLEFPAVTSPPAISAAATPISKSCGTGIWMG